MPLEPTAAVTLPRALIAGPFARRQEPTARLERDCDTGHDGGNVAILTSQLQFSRPALQGRAMLVQA